MPNAALLGRFQLLQVGLTEATGRFGASETATSTPAAMMLTYDEVCSLTGLCRETICRKAATGSLPKPIKFGYRTMRLRRSDCEAWVAGVCLSVRSMRANRAN